MGDISKHHAVYQRLMKFTADAMAFTAWEITKSLRDEGLQIDHSGMARECVHALMAPFVAAGVYAHRERKFGNMTAIYYEPRTDHGCIIALEGTPSIKMMDVDSSFVEQIGYDSDSKELRVRLATGHLYVYRDVSPQVFVDFIMSDSKGSFYNEHVKGKFR